MNDGTGLAVKPLLFLSSYAPLFLMLAIRFEDARLRIILAIFGVTGLLFLPLVLLIQKHGSPGQHTINVIQPAGNGASAYLAGYLLPFLTVSEPGPTDLAAYGIFLLVAFTVHVRTEMIQVNPTLFLWGWRIYAFTDTNGLQGHLICRKRVLPRDDVWAHRMTDDILIMKETKKPRS